LGAAQHKELRDTPQPLFKVSGVVSDIPESQIAHNYRQRQCEILIRHTALIAHPL
jgi:hypothetical protein